MNPLSSGLLEVAQALAQLEGTRNGQQAALRRAASTAYYALFHSLCKLCGDGLKLWTTGGDALQVAYRSLGHGKTADVLAASSTRALHPNLITIGDVFADLRSLREDADYSQPGRLGGDDKLLTRREIEAIVAVAREAVDLVDGLSSNVRKHLAILLVAGLDKGKPGRRRR